MDTPAMDTASVDRAVAEWLASTGAPSASIAIVRGDRLAYVRAYGDASLGPKVPSAGTTRYPIDSVSKEFTSAAVLLLAEQGKLSLDDPIAKWFPELRAAAAVTLRQLLTHTSGIRDYWPQDFLTPEMTRPTTLAAIIDEWVQRPLDFEPGTDWQYSNTGYVLAGAVVEKVSGQPLFEFLSRYVFEPLHMTQVTEYSPTGTAPRVAGGDAAGYTRHGLGPVVPAPKEGSGWLFGAASLVMRPTDLALWDLSLIDRSLLKAESYKWEFEPVVLKSGRTQDYALGLEVASVQGRLRIGHSGAGSGFLADNRLWPRERAAIVVLTNNDWADPSDLTDRIAFIVLPPTPEEARVRQIFQAFQDGRVDRGLFSTVGNFYLTSAVLADLKSSLSPLGSPRLIQLEHEAQRGGMTTRRWKILCPGARLEAIERSHPDGRIDEFMIAKRED
ncbi:MAG TPA: serine hydrolase domain-containing protein [Steroidobacteraceae bacterium]|nr:serine hydrolase domain-containing protein [Steroidobacteraceae bacterium]